MKPTIIFLFIFLATLSFGQNTDGSKFIPFQSQLLKDSTTYEKGIKVLAKTLLDSYADTVKMVYYDNVFRFHFALEDYNKTLSSLDSFAMVSGAGEGYKNYFGFHYRVHCLVMLSNSKDYNSDYEKEFKKLYNTLPDEAKSMVNNNFQRADINGEKQKFLDMTKMISVGGENIALIEAIDLIKNWNFWQIYQTTKELGLQQIAAFKAAETKNHQEKSIEVAIGGVIDTNKMTYITNVTLLNVETQKLLPNTTVVMKGSRITAVNASNKTNILKTGANIIDGSGKYLMPGLTDGHVHFFQSGGLYTRPDGLDLRKYMPYEKEIEWTLVNMQDALKRNIMNGITNVIDAGATYNFLELRDKYKGKTFAPNVHMSGPLLTTYEPDVFQNLGKDEPFALVKNEEEARKIVRDQLAYKPDFIKIWYILDPGRNKENSARKYLPIVKAIIDESHKNNLKVAIHATERITAQLAVENGCDYLVHSVEDEVITDDFVKMLKAKNVSVCPTLTVFPNYRKTFTQLLNYSNYELKNANPTQLGSLYDLKHIPEQSMINGLKSSILEGQADFQKTDSICLVNLKKMADGGVRIVAGTDAGNIGTMHGTSLVDELITMKKSGMSQWEVLKSATINAAHFMSREKTTGSVTSGKLADMVLLDKNPLENLEHLRSISLVINNGYVIKPDTLIKDTPEILAQRQLNAYNARNLEAFLEPFAEDVEIYQFPDKLLSKGKEEMRKGYSFFNDLPDLHCEITSRIIQNNIVIDKESVTGIGTPKPMEATAIYQAENGKIKKVYFIE